MDLGNLFGLGRVDDAVDGVAVRSRRLACSVSPARGRFESRVDTPSASYSLPHVRADHGYRCCREGTTGVVEDFLLRCVPSKSCLTAVRVRRMSARLLRRFRLVDRGRIGLELAVRLRRPTNRRGRIVEQHALDRGSQRAESPVCEAREDDTGSTYGSQKPLGTGSFESYWKPGSHTTFRASVCRNTSQKSISRRVRPIFIIVCPTPDVGNVSEPHRPVVFGRHRVVLRCCPSCVADV